MARPRLRSYGPALGLSFLLVLATSGPGHAQHVLDELPPGHWYEVPNSHMEDLAPPNPWRRGSVRSVVGAWSGGAYDTLRDRLVVWGGGHADYAGNELYVFDVEQLRWGRLTNPTTELDNNTVDMQPDGQPTSRHTYAGLAYIPPPVDRFWATGGSLWPGGQCGGLIWTYDFEASPPEAGWTQFDRERMRCGDIAAYDSATGYVWYQAVGRLFHFDPSDSESPPTSHRVEFTRKLNSNGAIDPTRRQFVIIGTGDNPRTWVHHIGDSTNVTGERLATTGATEIEQANAAGVAYDPVTDRIVAWSGQPDRGIRPEDVYTLNLDTAVWERHAPADDNTVIPTPATGKGTYGRFRYMPRYNAFILVNRAEQNVFFYKLAPGSGTGPLPRPDGGPAGSPDAGMTDPSSGSDAGSSAEDAGSSGSSDANGTASPDAGAGPAGGSMTGGCRVRSGDSPSFLALALALFLARTVRRRTARRRTSSRV